MKPVLGRLGFAYTVQASLPSGSGRRQPDYALFTTEEARRAAAAASGVMQFRGAVAVCDAKRFERDLDKRSRDGKGALSEDPVAQIIHYLTITKTRWGILTNGRHWRLYAAEGDLIDGACLDIDLIAVLEAGDIPAFRLFATLFSATSFGALPGTRCLNDRIVDGSRENAVAVGRRLQEQVFLAVPRIAGGLLRDDEHSPEDLALAFENALVVLYRVLFCLHAEERRLLPADSPHYTTHSLRRLRSDLATQIDAGTRFSDRSERLFGDLRALFTIVDLGDADLGVNAYNGGLFSAAAHPWLTGRPISDRALAPALDLLFRVGGRHVDYRSLSVRHLGTIFERLLAYRLVDSEHGLRLVPAPGRRRTGAWFTPEYVVDEIIERTLTPILDRRSAEVAAAKLRGADALERLLDLHILDPAMGSGHFLVGAAAFIARWIANDPSFDGPQTLGELQGMVAERCLYGVDINPMAVEVARLALWLTTARTDRPLCFLDQLRTGNSLVAADTLGLLQSGDLLGMQIARQATEMLTKVAAIAAIDTINTDDAHEQEQIAAALDEVRAPLLALADAAVDPPIGPDDGRPPALGDRVPGPLSDT